MGEQDLVLGVDRRPGEPTPAIAPSCGPVPASPVLPPPVAHRLAFWPAHPQPVSTDDGWIVYRMALSCDERLRALVDIPLAADTIRGLPPEHVRRVIGSVAARQLTRLAARGRLPAEPPLMPLRLVGLDPHVARLLGQGQLDLEPADTWAVQA